MFAAAVVLAVGSTRGTGICMTRHKFGCADDDANCLILRCKDQDVFNEDSCV